MDVHRAVTMMINIIIGLNQSCAVLGYPSSVALVTLMPIRKGQPVIPILSM